MRNTAHRSLAPTQTVQVSAGAVNRLSAADALGADRIDFDAWLLQPLQLDAQERTVRLLSQAAGPIALILAVAAGLIVAF